jgi:ABC-2 type transport system permease protein
MRADTVKGFVGPLGAVYRRELLSYLTTPTAYVFVAVFLVAIGAFTFQVGNFFAQGRADLAPFFNFHPWLFMVFLPAIAMRLWAEDARSGATELLLTLPIPTWALVLGKFLAAWSVAGIALLLTTPLWITINVLGDPDNAAILVGYLASFLMAGAYLAIGSAMSALTTAQVVAFVLAVLVAFVLTVLGTPIVMDVVRGWIGVGGVEALSSVAMLSHFDAAQRGVIELRSLFYFLSVIGLFLAWTALAVDARRGG